MDSGWRRVLAIGALVGLLAATPAGAQEPLTLRWEPAPDVVGCPSDAEVTASVHAALGEAPARADGVRVEAVVRRGRHGLVLQLHAEVAGQRGRRVLAGSSCRDLVEAMSLIVAMLLDAREPDRSVLENPYAPPNPYAEAGLASFDSGWETEAPGEDRRGGPSSVRVGLGAGVVGGVLPAPAASFALVGEVCGGAWCATLGARGLFPRSESLVNPTGASMNLWLGAASLGARYRVVRGLWEVGPALELELGALGASSRGIARPGEGRAPWAALVGGGFVRYQLGAARVGLEASATVPFTRPTFSIEGVGAVFRPRPASVGAAVTLGFALR